MNRRTFMRLSIFGAAAVAVPVAALAQVPKRWTVKEVASVFGVPPHLVGRHNTYTLMEDYHKITLELLRDSQFDMDKFVREAVLRESLEVEKIFWENWEQEVIFGNPAIPGPRGVIRASEFLSEA